VGRRLPRKALLAEIQRERAALDDTLARLSPRQMTRAGVTRGGWSVKDILAHLVEWQIPGYVSGSTSDTNGSNVSLQMSTAGNSRSPSWTGIDQDVQPGVWPAVTCAASSIGPRRIRLR
jgi:hypothetical protein